MAELVRNIRVQEALDAWATTKDARTFSDVLRRLVAGDPLLDISASQLADRTRGPQPGDRIAIGSQTDNSGKHLLLAYTDNERLGARTPNGISLGQPAHAVVEQAVRDYEGLVIDAGHPGVFIAYADEIRRGLGAEPAAAARLARDLVQRERPFEQFLAGLALAPVYLAVEPRRDETGEVTAVSVLTARGPDGQAVSAFFTSPSEAWTWAPEAEVRPTRLQNVARVVLETGQPAAIVNPAGPAATLTRETLADYAKDAGDPPPPGE